MRATRLNGTTYSRLMAACNKKELPLNRKMLAELAANNASSFSQFVKQALA